jgi:coniferyl-aldehyde dehydrogenase
MNSDREAIGQLESTFAVQRSAFLRAPTPPMSERLDLLSRIPGMLMTHAKRIAEALNSDYGYHPELTAYMFDVVNVVARAQYVARVLPTWMARDDRELEPHLYGSSKAYIEYQPKGVIGNMPAWNFPVDLSVGPLCEMLAAGNRVIIKPSEQTPAIGELLAEMIAGTFDRDRVAVVNGGVDLARHFSTLKWDHLLYTGNTAIGREVMLKAAQNLVPVTLELGGKNPTVFTEEAVTVKNVRTMLGSKLTKNGQLCITVDHCIVPASKLDAFVALVKDFVVTTFGDFTTSPLNCAVINQRQFDRLQRYVDDAKAHHPERVVELGSPANAGKSNGPCRMPLTLVIDPESGSLLDQNEVFGPVLPIVTYTDFDQVIERIQAGERPLGIYIFSDQPALVERLQRNTSSGGFCVNAASLQGAQENLGFGGVGKSGMGRHHGFEGFREFSNPRGCVELASDANLEPLMSPHGELTRQFIKAVTGGMLG